MTAVQGYDATTSNVIHLPRGQHGGYTSGRGIAWTPAQWAADPSAIRIAQSPALSVDEAGCPDVLDYETGAATLSDVAAWAKAMLAAYAAGTRPGQRRPAVYASKSNLTAIANALIAGGVKSGVGLWIAEWGIGKAAAEALVNNASGPFPVIGVQYSDGGEFDYDVFSSAWLADVSGTPKPGPVPAPVPAPAPGPSPLPASPLSVTPHKEYVLNVARGIAGYTGTYVTRVFAAGSSELVIEVDGDETHPCIVVPAPGEYLVKTIAHGHAETDRTVTVAA